MEYANRILELWQDAGEEEAGLRRRALQALDDCAESCAVCADACLAETDVTPLRACIGMNLDCADICRTTLAVISRRAVPADGVLTALLAACIEACRACE